MFFLFSIPIRSQEIPRIYWQKNKIEDSQILNQERINSQWDEYAPTPIIGEKFLIFQSQRPGPYEEHSLWYSFNKNFGDPLQEPLWSDPLPLFFPLSDEYKSSTMVVQNKKNFTVNSDSFVGHPSLLIQNSEIKEIYFTSVNSQLKTEHLDIFYVQYKNNRWGEIEFLNEICSNFDDLMPFITKDGKKLFFVSNRPGGYGGYDIWYSERDFASGNWSKPVNLGASVNTEYDEVTPFVIQNGQKLIFSSNRPGGFGGYDLYVSNWNGLAFEIPLNLGKPFNSEQNDEALKIEDKGTWAYFASDRIHLYNRGRYDIFRFFVPRELIEFFKILFEGKILDLETKEPVGPEATIKIEFGTQTLITKSDRKFKNDGKTIENNFKIELYSGRIYRMEITAPGYYPLDTILDYKEIYTKDQEDSRIFYLQPIKKIEPVIRNIAGIVVEDGTMLPLPGSKVVKIEADQNIIELKLDEFAQFAVPVRKKEKFQIRVDSPGYESKIEDFEENEKLDKIIIKLKKLKDPCEIKQLECIWNTRIFFDLDKAEIKLEELNKLKLVAEILKLYPEEKIEIAGHTDLSYKGPKEKSYQYNLNLSIQRAQNVKKKLVEFGIEESRLIIKGYSFTKPLVDLPDAIRGAINRRVEFMKIQKNSSNF